MQTADTFTLKQCERPVSILWTFSEFPVDNTSTIREHGDSFDLLKEIRFS